jgi:hypothetical protein
MISEDIPLRPGQSGKWMHDPGYGSYTMSNELEGSIGGFI